MLSALMFTLYVLFVVVEDSTSALSTGPCRDIPPNPVIQPGFRYRHCLLPSVVSPELEGIVQYPMMEERTTM